MATLTYVDGAPGSGKTLWIVTEIENLRKREGRPVYYDGVEGVTLEGWIPLRIGEPGGSTLGDVHNLPTGSIIFIDEAQRHWPQRDPRKDVPASVEPFATHRHRGHQFFIATQRTTGVDHFIRGCATRHLHFERAFGLPRARVFEWSGKMGKPDDKWQRLYATRWTFWYSDKAFWAPKTQMGSYKSSDEHTVKTKLPIWKLVGVLAVVAMILHGGYTFLSHARSFGQAPGAEKGKGGVGEAAERPTPQPAVITGEQWASRFAERIPGLPYTASAYDAVYRVVSMPRIAGCMEVIADDFNKCVCNTQQGTVIRTMRYIDCKNWIKYGQFDPTVADERASSSGIADLGFKAPASGGSFLSTAADAFGVK